MPLSKTIRWTSIIACGAIILFFAPLALIIAGNASGALLDLLLNRTPTGQELVGRYKLQAPWGISALEINPDGTFREEIRANDKAVRVVTGRWQQEEGSPNFISIDFKPFGMVWDEDHDREISYYTIEFRKPHFGATYGLVNDDLGEAFKRQ